MLFRKKDSGKEKCENCGYLSSKDYSFCPNCGNSLLDAGKELEDFGLLGKDDFSGIEQPMMPTGFSLTDKLFSSMVNSMMKSLDKQFREMDKEMNNSSEIRTMPNGIKIKISGPFSMNQKRREPVEKKKSMDESTMKKISSLPREKAKTNVKRLGNKVVYELATPGVSSLEDIFISKLESGYEIKAVGDKKLYVNSIPINLPIKKYSIMKNKVSVEFFAGE